MWNLPKPDARCSWSKTVAPAGSAWGHVSPVMCSASRVLVSHADV